MAVISPTAANIRVEPDQPSSAGTAAEALDRFQLVYKSSSGIIKAVNSSVAEARIVGMTYVTAEIGDLIRFVTNGGKIKSTSSLWAPTEFYYLSSTDGKMCLMEDIAEDEIVTCVGYAISATLFQLNIVPTGLPKVV